MAPQRMDQAKRETPEERLKRRADLIKYGAMVMEAYRAAGVSSAPRTPVETENSEADTVRRRARPVAEH
jgi:hypothetical protein